MSKSLVEKFKYDNLLIFSTYDPFDIYSVIEGDFLSISPLL